MPRGDPKWAFRPASGTFVSALANRHIKGRVAQLLTLLLPGQSANLTSWKGVLHVSTSGRRSQVLTALRPGLVGCLSSASGCFLIFSNVSLIRSTIASLLVSISCFCGPFSSFRARCCSVAKYSVLRSQVTSAVEPFAARPGALPACVLPVAAPFTPAVV